MPKPDISFPSRAEYVPGLILEQCINIRALLGTIFTLQIELLAHLTNSDRDAMAQDYGQKLDELTEKFALEARDSVERQPPIE